MKTRVRVILLQNESLPPVVKEYFFHDEEKAKDFHNVALTVPGVFRVEHMDDYPRSNSVEVSILDLARLARSLNPNLEI